MFRAILVLVGILSLPSIAEAAAPTAACVQVQAAVKAYVDAANRGDVAAMMRMVSRKDGVVSITDGSIERGWETIRTINDQIMGKDGGYKMSIASIDVLMLSATVAVAVTPFTFAVASDHGSMQVPGAVSIVLEKSNGRWLVVHEHESIQTRDISMAD
jgi:uncharacterized protein (TIGR02246 family)